MINQTNVMNSFINVTLTHEGGSRSRCWDTVKEIIWENQQRDELLCLLFFLLYLDFYEAEKWLHASFYKTWKKNKFSANSSDQHTHYNIYTHTHVQVFSCCPIRVQGGVAYRCSRAFCRLSYFSIWPLKKIQMVFWSLTVV